MSAQPTPASVPAPEESLRNLLRTQLEKSRTADPLALINPVMPMLSTEDYEQAARYGVGRMLSEEARHLRRRSMSKPDIPPRSAKWEAAAQTAKARPDLFAARIVVAVNEHGEDVYAFLGDCSATMLKEAARLLRERGDAAQAAAHAQADRYVALGRKLRGGALVRSLPLATVEAVLDQ